MFEKKAKLMTSIILSLTLANISIPTTVAMASTITPNEYEYQLTILQNHQEDFYDLITQMELYSFYNGETIILDHKIVEDGILTERQYKATQDVDIYCQEILEHKKNTATTRILPALPPLLILALKAIGAMVGTLVVEKIAHDFIDKGFTASCNKHKEYASIKKFCEINGYL